MSKGFKDAPMPPRPIAIGMLVAFFGGAAMVFAGAYAKVNHPSLSRTAIVSGITLEMAFIGLQVYWQISKRKKARA